MGLGLGITIFLITESIVFWLLASLSPTAGARLRPIIAVFALGYLAFAVNSFRFFFLAPVITEVLISSCLILAILACKGAHPGGHHLAVSGSTPDTLFFSSFQVPLRMTKAGALMP